MPIVFGFCALMGIGWSVSNGWLGIGLGLALIASAVVAQARGYRALVAFVWKRPSGVLWTLATAALGALYIALGLAKLAADQKLAAAADAHAQATLTAQKAHAAEIERLTQQLPESLRGFRNQLIDAERSAESAGPSEGLRLARLVKDEIVAHVTRFDKHPPAELLAVEQEADQRVSVLSARMELARVYDSIDAQIGFAKEAISHKNWLAADGDYAGALDAVISVENSRATLGQYISKTFDAEHKRAEIKALRARIAGQVAKARKQEEAEDDKRRRQAAYEAVCGPAPGLEPGDTGWVLLKMKLEKVANDPDSIEIVDCTPPVLSEKVCWATRCNIRGKNAFGARLLTQKWFAFSKLGVEEATLPGH